MEPGKENAMIFRKLCLLALVLVPLAACSATSRFHTEPKGAKLFINGDYIGETPVVYDDSYGLPSRMHVEIQKEGYDDLDMYMDKTMAYQAMPTFIFPYSSTIAVFWAYRYASDYRINLTPLKQKSQDPADEAAPEE